MSLRVTLLIPNEKDLLTSPYECWELIQFDSGNYLFLGQLIDLSTKRDTEPEIPNPRITLVKMDSHDTIKLCIGNCVEIHNGADENHEYLYGMVYQWKGIDTTKATAKNKAIIGLIKSLPPMSFVILEVSY